MHDVQRKQKNLQKIRRVSLFVFTLLHCFRADVQLQTYGATALLKLDSCEDNFRVP
jgi:hypothetical protein